MGGFSFASVVLSYFLTAGGLLTGSILITKLHTTSEVVGLLCWAIGSFIGGFFAARARRGSTIIEPAIGAVLVVATLVISVMGGESARELWHAGGSSVGKFVAEVTAALVMAAIVCVLLAVRCESSLDKLAAGGRGGAGAGAGRGGGAGGAAARRR